VPLAHLVRLSLHIAWTFNLVEFWLKIGPLSVLVAVLLAFIQFPHETRLSVRMLLEYGKADAKITSLAMTILPLGLYLFLGLLLVSIYNDIIVSARFFATYDAQALRVDSWLLGGSSISTIAHNTLDHLPHWFTAAEVRIYYWMFLQIGACLLLVTAKGGREAGMRFTGTVLMAYYIALVIFFVIPIQGPYYTCASHMARSVNLPFYQNQEVGLSRLNAFWSHRFVGSIGFDYWIGFPALHIAQPVIILWFTRRWRRIFWMLAAYDVPLFASTMLLEQHYAVDVIGGFLVGILAIAITDCSVPSGAPSN
jgi:hypothetical protein